MGCRVTDSFSDGGEFNTPARCLGTGAALVAAGADIVDVGGQSRDQELVKFPWKKNLSGCCRYCRCYKEIPVPISVDTTRAPVARAAVEAGADLVNDISGALLTRICCRL